MSLNIEDKQARHPSLLERSEELLRSQRAFSDLSSRHQEQLSSAPKMFEERTRDGRSGTLTRQVLGRNPRVEEKEEEEESALLLDIRKDPTRTSFKRDAFLSTLITGEHADVEKELRYRKSLRDKDARSQQGKGLQQELGGYKEAEKLLKSRPPLKDPFDLVQGLCRYTPRPTDPELRKSRSANRYAYSGEPPPLSPYHPTAATASIKTSGGAGERRGEDGKTTGKERMGLQERTKDTEKLAREDLESFLMGRSEEIDWKLNNRNHTQKNQIDNQNDKHEIHNHRESKQAESAKIASVAHPREAPSKSTTEWKHEKASIAFTAPTPTPSHDHINKAPPPAPPADKPSNIHSTASNDTSASSRGRLGIGGFLRGMFGCADRREGNPKRMQSAQEEPPGRGKAEIQGIRAGQEVIYKSSSPKTDNDVEISLPLRLALSRRKLDSLHELLAAVGEEAQLRGVILSGEPDNVQYGQDLLEAVLNEA
ncbi:hypothetical protein GUITHDRAFT_112925 [Guillardia theta CCMP2712]|uniref:Uncharacterized protein n=1 Tax=Guillardia theta (strain CCMP2712) TaxID=905079 RepID=L1IXG6_GUITC|nr:hypothetical protein GUITHDRAFT_112925 [Guillardia theta CCMP2712]EKX40921.1 hypothetical protein GUITHDRAFT_112925 [Guillardia theta CCMP2712]|eukprot:XP_005827901.1 hypothetical protein GUITHDRAFT_112925 [Guillardia theta CCMP2712]